METDFLTIIWLFPISLFIHEMEEWNIIKWYDKHFVEMPKNKSNISTRFFLIFISVVCFVWTALAVATQLEHVAALIMLPFIAIVVQNTIQHIYGSGLFKSVCPGLVSAVLLLLPVSVYILFVGISRHWIPWWALGILIVYWVMGTRETILARNRMMKSFEKINSFSNFMVKKLKILR